MHLKNALELAKNGKRGLCFDYYDIEHEFEEKSTGKFYLTLMFTISISIHSFFE